MPKRPPDDLPLFRPALRPAREERAPSASTFRAAVKQQERLYQATAGAARAVRGGHHQRGRYPVAVRPAGRFARRAVVKARVVVLSTPKAHTMAREHVEYIEREGVSQDRGAGELYQRAGEPVSAGDWLAQTRGDPHQFRFIVSPEDARELDLKSYIREFMRRVESDVGRPLRWVAVDHYNTEHPHTHIVLSGRDANGEAFRLSRETISHGLRERARELATQELGPRTEQEIATALRREVSAERLTSLDAQLARIAAGDRIDLGARPGAVAAKGMEAYLTARLQHLEQSGLATPFAPRAWRMQAGWQEDLKELGERGDIIKRMHRALAEAPAAPRVHASDEAGLRITGRLAEVGLYDELHDRRYLLIEAAGGEVHYVKAPPAFELAGAGAGEIVELTTERPSHVKPGDRVLARHAGQHGGVYEAARHESELRAEAAFLERGIAPEAYVKALERRAARLARLGLLEALGPGRWRVPADLETRLEALDRDAPNRPALAMRRVDPRALTAQAGARGPAWLDDVNPHTAATRGFGAEVRAAHRARAALLAELGLAPDDPKLAQRLAALERTELAEAYGQRKGLAPVPLSSAAVRAGTLAESLEAPSGKRYAVLTSEREFALAPWQEGYHAQLGRTVAFGLDRDGRPFVRPLARGLAR